MNGDKTVENGRTIAAISTAQAPGGIGIIRISGSDAKTIASRVFVPAGSHSVMETPGYHALYGTVFDAEGKRIDEAIALIFTAPKSFTGEDVVELSCHGGMYVLKQLLATVFAAGAAPADPGEFTRRAFLNGKMDLTRAEAVMQMISAQGESAARAAAEGNGGALARRIQKIRSRLVASAAHLSAWADYPEDEVPEITSDDLLSDLNFALSECQTLLSQFDAGRALREGVKTVIVGRPNVGKSTLMNLLAGCERSIVTEYAGTTRDVVEEVVLVGGIPLCLADTAGIRTTADPVEQIGVDRAKKRLESAQLVFAVFDSSENLEKEDLDLIQSIGSLPAIAVINKVDLPQVIDINCIKKHFKYLVYISAETGEGFSALESAVSDILNTNHLNPSEGMLYTERQRDAVRRAEICLEEAKTAVLAEMTFDAVTVSVEGAISAFLELTGERVSETVVDEVFSKFCVGK
ncbi:tRNA uridine-5-carboxymethylaminomethyl(34) synthesis GTPase MnmE [Clostridiales bacterium NSJ-40]|uniref:tRNA modification GTPase MnmE n=1 Tax=Yeguia hominis TaxID=2763662 RepID=A0A926HRP4_9FIRM|nr:tRNA uridine-5-carboxymethylaminomethyl(34) synthesis GTPase MnmE [Yeguia hominis]MBC8533989.1 tRNA uridine-5-carboxymethylaminomethyl(34) synthesis GTPase MnmE [Yeguia hominis]